MTNFVTIRTIFFKTSKKKLFFICNILGLALACLIIFINPGKFKTNVTINYPSSYDFLLHSQIKKFINLENNFLFHDQFKTNFNKNLMSNKNLREFINNNRKNNLLLQGSGDKIKINKKSSFNSTDGNFFLVFEGNIDGKELFIHYIDHIKKKTINDFFIGYRELILLNIQNRKVFLKDNELNQNYYFQSQLSYEMMIVGKEIKELMMLYDEFNPSKFDYVIYEDLPSAPSYLYYSNYSIIFFGLMFGSLLFLVIIFLNSSAVNKKKIFF